MSVSPVASFVVVCCGTIDRDATMLAFESALDEYATSRALNGEKLGEAIGAVFDAHRGAAINSDALVSLVSVALAIQMNGYSLLKEDVQTFVKENNGDTRESGALFYTRKGKGGGTRRWSDIPETSAKL